MDGRHDAAPMRAGAAERGVPGGGVGQSPARDRAALAGALDPIITIDIAGTIFSVSDSIERVLGWKPAALTGRNVNVLMPEPHRSEHDGYLAEYQRTGRERILNRPRRLEALHKDGRRVPVQMCIARAEVSGGEPLFVGIMHDMADVAAAERGRDLERAGFERLVAEQTAALHESHVRLREAERMALIGTLAAGLGHDITNILLPVRADLRALRAQAGPGGRVGGGSIRLIEEIERAVRYLQQLSDAMRSMAKAPADRAGAPESAGADFAAWRERCGPMLEKAIPRHVRVEWSVEAGLSRVPLAEHALTQVMLNLLVNAGQAITARAGRPSDGLVRVEVTARRDALGSGVEIAVTDNGVGMSAEVRERAFEMYFTTKPRGEGTGLGLTLVRSNVEQAGGRVWLEPGPGGGTRVRIRLPEAAAAPRYAEAHATVMTRHARAGMVVRQLLAEGIEVDEGGEGLRGEIVVTDPEDARLGDVRSWRSRVPGGALVLMGRAEGESARAWSGMGAIVIDPIDDFDTVRAAVNLAVLVREGRLRDGGAGA